MHPTTPNIEPKPSTQPPKAVAGGSLKLIQFKEQFLRGREILSVGLAMCYAVIAYSQSTTNAHAQAVLTDNPTSKTSFGSAELHPATEWQNYTNNPIVSPGPPGAWDAGALGTMTVAKLGNIYHLYYEAWGIREKSTADYYTLQIGHATSNDGRHWVKDPANPVVPKGAAGDWDCDGTWDPSVIYENGTFKMWYGGGMSSCDWGYATSTDGVHFTKHGQLSHLGNVEDDHVVHDQATGRYFMYYWDRKHVPQGLYCAQSLNETNFDFAHAQPIHLTGVPYTTRMYKFPNVFQEDGRWFMYFSEYIYPNCKGSWMSYATSQDGLQWQVQNAKVFVCHDALVVKMSDNLYYMYYGPDSFFDAKNCDIRLAIYKGELDALAKK